MLQLKRALDARVSSAYGSGNGALGSALSDVRNGVNDVLTNNWPQYADVASGFAQRLRLESALKQGVKMYNSDPKDIEATLQALSPVEASMFRAGMMSRLRQKIASATSPSAISNRLETPNEQARLESAFGDKATFDQFLDAVDAEHRLASVPTPHGPGSFFGGFGAFELLHNPVYGGAMLGVRPALSAANTGIALARMRRVGGPAAAALLDRLFRPSPLTLPAAEGAGAGAGGLFEMMRRGVAPMPFGLFAPNSGGTQ